jgi:2'-5' RNA ligase
MQGVFEFYREQPPRPARPERLFFGLVPDRESSKRTRQFGERFLGEHRLKGRPLKADCLHVSLHHVGDFRRLRTKFIYAARKAASAVTMQPFEVTFRSVRSFEIGPAFDDDARQHPLVLLGEGDALVALHKGLGAAMAKIGLKAALDFTPHMTLWYGPERIPAQPIEPIRFTVDEFALIHSELGFARHTIVDRWRFEG